MASIATSMMSALGCIDAAALGLFVSRHVPIEECSFCGARGQNGMLLGDLFGYMAGCLAAEWARCSGRCHQPQSRWPGQTGKRSMTLS